MTRFKRKPTAFGHHERLRLEVSGSPKWEGNHGRLELYYDKVDRTFRAIQPVTVDESRQDPPRAEESAAPDVGANTLVACTTTEEIARLQSLLPEGQHQPEYPNGELCLRGCG